MQLYPYLNCRLMLKQTEDLILFPSQRPEDSPGFLTWQIAMCWQRRINQDLGACNITYTQFIVMAILVRLMQQQKLVFQHQVASKARIDRMMTSRVMSSLEAKKLIKREKPTGDARTNSVTITRSGEECLAAAVALVKKLEEEFFAPDTKGHLKEQLIHCMREILPHC